MKRMIRIGFFLSWVAAAAAGCTTDFREVHFDDFQIDSLRMVGTSKIYISASLKITNPTRQAIRLRAADFDVSADSVVFARLRLREEASAPAQTVAVLSVPLELQITDWLALIGSVNVRTIEAELDRLLLNGSLRVKAGCWNRTLQVQNRTLKQLVDDGL
ncbi:MAG: LEA type 2 family protein [Prevotellaceae bacterium]|nr:LEA type 2 family protein [Prevotellaceae bacterium]